MKLRNKKILITAGPTWVKIDDVRVISNTATGETGILLARVFSRFKAKVTLLLGPGKDPGLGSGIIVKRFKFFDELKHLLERELKYNKYDLAAHSAAVSDYRPCVSFSNKIKSGLKKISIKLKPTPKIISIFKRMQPGLFLIGFKYEPDASREDLIREALSLIERSRADLVVSNTLRQGRYTAYLAGFDKCSKPLFTKTAVARSIIRIIKDYDA